MRFNQVAGAHAPVTTFAHPRTNGANAMHLATFLAHVAIASALLAAWGFAVVMLAAHLLERHQLRRSQHHATQRARRTG